MSEELDKKNDLTEAKPKEGEEEVTLTPTELEAVAQGWVPKDQWKGDPEDWTPAKQYLKYGEVEAELKRVRKETTHLNKVVSKMKDFYSNVKEDAKKEVLDALKRSKRDALAKEDFEEVAKIDAQIDVVEEGITRSFKRGDEVVKRIEAEKAPEPIPEFYEWHKQNRWYKLPENRTGKDEASTFADTLAVGYVNSNPSTTPVEVYEYVTKQMKKSYPELYENPARKAPPAVDEGGERTPKDSNKGKLRLTPEEKDAAKHFGLTEDQYAKHLEQYNKMKGIA